MENNEQLQDLMADKIALDQMYGQCIKELHQTKKLLLLKESACTDLIKQNSALLKEKEEWLRPKDKECQITLD